MNKFNEMCEAEMGLLDEGLGKSLVTAGMVGLGALGSASAINSREIPPVTHQKVPRVSDETILAKTLPLTKWAEGYKSLVYLDSKKVPTIGYGSNLKASHIRKELERLGYSPDELLSGDRSIKEEDAETMLKRGLVQALKDAKNFTNNWDNLDPIAKIVVLDMSYNLGATRLSGFKNFKAALEAEDYATASAEMVDSKWYDDVGRRSKRLVELMNTLAERS
jgi:lysozyme